MKSRNHKFKLYKFNENSEKSNLYFKVDFSTFKENEFINIASRLDKFERTVNSLIADSDNKFDKKDADYRKNGNGFNKEIIILKNPKIIRCENPIKQLMSFYFTYQFYFSSPSTFSVNEYHKCISHFNSKLPKYLIYAILSRSSLNSPIPQLYMKNLDYCKYYYDFSVKHLNMSIDKKEIDIYMLHTLLILMWVDVGLCRQFSKCSRIVACIKLVHILGLDNIDLNSDYNQFGLPQSSVKKLLIFIKYYIKESSKIFNLPKVLMWKELEYDYSSMRMEEEKNDRQSINLSLIHLPKEYNLVYKSFEYYASLGFTDI